MLQYDLEQAIEFHEEDPWGVLMAKESVLMDYKRRMARMQTRSMAQCLVKCSSDKCIPCASERCFRAGGPHGTAPCFTGSATRMRSDSNVGLKKFPISHLTTQPAPPTAEELVQTEVICEYFFPLTSPNINPPISESDRIEDFSEYRTMQPCRGYG